MKAIFTFITAFLTYTSALGQIASTSEDSIKELLCHKWNVQKITQAGQAMPASFEHILYEFYNDKTFKRSIIDKVDLGTWEYDPSNGWIYLKSKRLKLYLISLKEDEILLVAEKPSPKNIPMVSHLQRMDK